MTEKELRKLDRHDLLELLVEQTREASRLRLTLDEREERLLSATASVERLKAKLGDKDEQIERLKGRLDEKDSLASKLKAKLDAKDAEMASQDEAHDEDMSRLKAKLDSKDAELARLEERKRFLEDRNAALEADIARCRSLNVQELKSAGFTDKMIEILGAMS